MEDEHVPPSCPGCDGPLFVEMKRTVLFIYYPDQLYTHRQFTDVKHVTINWDTIDEYYQDVEALSLHCAQGCGYSEPLGTHHFTGAGEPPNPATWNLYQPKEEFDE